VLVGALLPFFLSATIKGLIMLDTIRKKILVFAGILSGLTLGFLVTNEKSNVEQSNSLSEKSISEIQKQNYFEDALKVVLNHEGYLSDDKYDKGGLTKWGISLAFLEAESIDVDGDGDVDRDDIIALTKGGMQSIYLKYFWEKNGYDRLLNKNIAIKMFDIAVNTGSSRANKILKKSIANIGDEYIEIDGVLDQETVDEANLIDADVLLNELRKEQKQFYLNIISITPSYAKFKNGWLARAAW
jgi:lysozyme family protein